MRPVFGTHFMHGQDRRNVYIVGQMHGKKFKRRGAGSCKRLFGLGSLQ